MDSSRRRRLVLAPSGLFGDLPEKCDKCVSVFLPIEWCNCNMSAQWARSALLLVLLSSSVCAAQDKAPARLILKVDAIVSGPFDGQRSSSCTRVYSDGKVLYASWRNSAATVVDKQSGKESRPEQTVSLGYHLEKSDVWELSSFLESKILYKLPEKVAPPHPPIDYFEEVTVQIIGLKGVQKLISTREFYVASLEEKARYPSALIVLMDKIDEIENEVNAKGKPSEIPSDCRLKPKSH